MWLILVLILNGNDFHVTGTAGVKSSCPVAERLTNETNRRNCVLNILLTGESLLQICSRAAVLPFISPLFRSFPLPFYVGANDLYVLKPL